MSLQHIAQHLAAKGRGPDSVLVHMTPREVAGLQALAHKYAGAGLTVNPDTGLPEAGILSAILPVIAGVALGPAGLGMSELMAAATVGGVSTLATGSLSKGLSAGMGAYGGAGLSGGLSGLGASDILTKAAFSDPSRAQDLVNPVDTVSATVQPGAWDKLSAGAKAAWENPKAYIDQLGGGMSALKLAGMAASPMFADQMVQTKTPMPSTGSYVSPYTGFYRRPTGAQGAGDSSERRWFDQGYTMSDGSTRPMASGGLTSLKRFDGGGAVSAIQGGPVTRPLTPAEEEFRATTRAEQQRMNILNDPYYNMHGLSGDAYMYLMGAGPGRRGAAAAPAPSLGERFGGGSGGGSGGGGSGGSTWKPGDSYGGSSIDTDNNGVGGGMAGSGGATGPGVGSEGGSGGPGASVSQGESIGAGGPASSGGPDADMGFNPDVQSFAVPTPNVVAFDLDALSPNISIDAALAAAIDAAMSADGGGGVSADGSVSAGEGIGAGGPGSGGGPDGDGWAHGGVIKHYDNGGQVFGEYTDDIQALLDALRSGQLNVSQLTPGQLSMLKPWVSEQTLSKWGPYIQQFASQLPQQTTAPAPAPNTQPAAGQQTGIAQFANSLPPSFQAGAQAQAAQGPNTQWKLDTSAAGIQKAGSDLMASLPGAFRGTPDRYKDKDNDVWRQTVGAPPAPPGMAMGGLAGLRLAEGGRLLRGAGDGVSDSIPANINGTQPAALADGEFVVPARAVSELGNGSTEAGARQLYAMLDRIQNQRKRTTKNIAKRNNPREVMPA